MQTLRLQQLKFLPKHPAFSKVQAVFSVMSQPKGRKKVDSLMSRSKREGSRRHSMVRNPKKDPELAQGIRSLMIRQNLGIVQLQGKLLRMLLWLRKILRVYQMLQSRRLKDKLGFLMRTMTERSKRVSLEEMEGIGALITIINLRVLPFLKPNTTRSSLSLTPTPRRSLKCKWGPLLPTAKAVEAAHFFRQVVAAGPRVTRMVSSREWEGKA